MTPVIRTCVGCRQRADKTDLVRVIAVKSSTGWSIEADERGTRPGRGAHVHPSSRCLQDAIARKAFGRALRIAGPYSVESLKTWWLEQDADRTGQRNQPGSPEWNRSRRS